MIEQGTREYWRATFALSLGSFFIFMMVYLTHPLLPLFTEHFQITPAWASLSVSVVTFSISIALLIYGPLSDAIGRKVIMGWSMLGAVIMTILASMATDYTWLLVLRALQGLCLAGLPSIAMAYMGEEFSPKALSLGIGMYISANSLGGLSGRLFSGLVADLWGWQASFLSIGGISLVFVFIFVWLLPPSRQFQKVPFHLGQAAGAMARHLRNPVLSLAFLVGGLHFFVFLGSFNFITFLLSGPPYRLSPTFLGLLFLTYLAGTVSSTLSGKLASRWGRTNCLLIGILLLALGIICTLHHALWVILCGMLLESFGFFFAHSASTSWVNAHAQFARASASSLYLVSYYLGGGLGSVYMGLFWNAWGWPGVVSGSLFILLITFGCTLLLRQAERKESGEMVASRT